MYSSSRDSSGTRCGPRGRGATRQQEDAAMPDKEVVRRRAALRGAHAPVSILVTGIVLALALSGCQAVTGAKRVVPTPPALAGVVQPPATGAYIGVFRPPAPFDPSALDTYTATISPKKPAIVMWYQPWANGRTKFDPAAAVALYARGAIPMVTWEPWDTGSETTVALDTSNEAAFKLANIIGGTYDPYIRTFARDVKSARGPVMIRLMHEMNGNWYPWSGFANGNTPQEFVAAWRHVHDLFVSEGATNVTWVWSINRESVPDTPANAFAGVSGTLSRLMLHTHVTFVAPSLTKRSWTCRHAATNS